MTDIDKLIQIERAEIGTKESPAGSNKQKYGEAYGWNGVPWCVMFQWWCMKEAGLSRFFYGGNKIASCGTLASYHRSQGQYITSDYAKGDFILFNFSGGTTPQHIGLCVEYTGSTVTTIDGNTGNLSEDNGGAVMERKRTIGPKCKIVGGIRWCQPSKGGSKQVEVALEQVRMGDKGKLVLSLQLLLNGKGLNRIEPDGLFGLKTDKAVKLYQTSKGLVVDGVVGANTWSKLLTE